MAYPAPVLTALGRLKSFFNGGIWVPAQGSPGYNPGGFDGDGHAVNFVPALRDVATVGEGVAAVAVQVEQTAERIEAAVEAIEAGPVTSVNGRSGAVTGLVEQTAFGALATDLRQEVEDAIAAIPEAPLFLPITMTVPAANATGLGAGGTYTFVVQAFAGDTVGFYPDYPVPLASRFVNVFEPGGNVPVATLPVAGTGTAFPVNFTGSGLQTSHAYDFQAGYTDAQGNSVLSQRVRATTAAQFKPSVGQAYEGGYLAFENFGDGQLFDLVQGPKSMEQAKPFQGSNTLFGMPSRLNGPGNTDAFISFAGGAGTGGNAAQYARSVAFGTGTPYLAAIDEARAISFKLRPANAPAGTPFVSGGSEAFTNVGFWSSTENTESQAASNSMTTGGEGNASKTSSFLVRPIKRIAVTPPIPIGTYVAAQGGWLWFYLTDLSDGTPKTYAVFKADKAVEVTRAYGASGSEASDRRSRTNGVANTARLASGGDSPAGQYCFDLVHGGKDDWYLGAMDEMLAGYRMNSQLPTAQRLNTSGGMWSSTETDASSARGVDLASGNEVPGAAKTANYTVIPIRRVLLSAL